MTKPKKSPRTPIHTYAWTAANAERNADALAQLRRIAAMKGNPHQAQAIQRLAELNKPLEE